MREGFINTVPTVMSRFQIMYHDGVILNNKHANRNHEAETKNFLCILL